MAESVEKIEHQEEEEWDRYALLNHFELVDWELTNVPNLQLETLDMDNCNLNKVPPAIMEIEYYAFRDVQAVSFNDNPEITNADVLGKLSDLQAINMCGSGLSEIPNSWSNLTKLQILGLGNVPSLTGFGSMRNLSSITWLDLGGCGLKRLPEEVTHLNKLVVLALGGNEGIDIDDSICCLRNLQKLALNSCGLTGVPRAIYSLVKLTHLHLDDNMLETLEEEFAKLKDLQEVSVTGNSNLSFPSLLACCESVRTIIIDESLDLAGLSHSLRHRLRLTNKTLKSDGTDNSVMNKTEILQSISKLPNFYAISTPPQVEAM